MTQRKDQHRRPLLNATIRGPSREAGTIPSMIGFPESAMVDQPFLQPTDEIGNRACAAQTGTRPIAFDLGISDITVNTRTPALACRTLDILHVASALTLKVRHFLTFDARQRKLAEIVGLKPIVVQ